MAITSKEHKTGSFFIKNNFEGESWGKGCVFFKDGLCELHTLGLKPTEGILSYHTLQEENINFQKSVTWNVAKEWVNTRNIPVIIEILLRLENRG